MINNKINHFREICLRAIYSNKISSFKELLERDGSVSIHNRKLQILATEMFKVCNNILINEIFNKRNSNYQTTFRTFQLSLLEVYKIELKACCS